MFRLLSVALLAIVPILAQDAPPEMEVLLGKAMDQYQKGNYPAAIESFQRLSDMNPAASHWYLSQIYMSQYIQGSRETDNVQRASRARGEFEQLLQMNKENGVVMASLGCLSYEEATTLETPSDRDQKMDDARSWFQRWLAVDAESRPAHYALGVVDTQKLFYALMDARGKIGMKPDAAAPLTDPDVRHEVNKRLEGVIEDGLTHFKYALDLEPADDGAMMFMGILIRERADLRDTQEDYNKDVALSRVWGEKSRRAKSQRRTRPDAIQTIPGLPSMVPPVPPSCGHKDH